MHFLKDVSIKLPNSRTERWTPYEKKVLVSIGSSTFFANFQYSRAKKGLDPILTYTFFSYGSARGRAWERALRSLRVAMNLLYILKTVWLAISIFCFTILNCWYITIIGSLFNSKQPFLWKNSFHFLIRKFLHHFSNVQKQMLKGRGKMLTFTLRLCLCCAFLSRYKLAKMSVFLDV